MREAPTDHRRAIAERNVRSILDAAERLLRRGDPLSISAVAAEAGVSRPTVYAHFSDRERLLTAVVERAVAGWHAVAERLELERGPADEALVRLIELGWEEISRSAHIAEAAAAQLDPEAMTRSHELGRRLVRRLTVRGRREGVFRTDVPADWLVTAVFALIHAAHAEARTGVTDSDTALRSLSRTVPDLFRRTGDT